jgi:hypothetical protein
MEAIVQIITGILLVVILVVGVGITIVERLPKKKNHQTNK